MYQSQALQYYSTIKTRGIFSLNIYRYVYMTEWHINRKNT